MNSSPAKNQKNSVSKIAYGDIFRIGEHLLACGDATDADLVSRLIGKRQVNAIVSDPPYGVSYTQAKAGIAKIKVTKDILNDDISSEGEYAAFTEKWLRVAVPHLARKNSVYIFNADPMLFALREGMQKAGVRFSQLLIWIKSNAVIGRKDYLPQHELIAFGWHGTHEFRKAKDKSLLFSPKPSRSALHPTQKPIPLLRRLILNSTHIGDTVYDCFAGSGSTGMAAEQTKRITILIEGDEESCCTIIDRFAKLFGLTAEHIHQET